MLTLSRLRGCCFLRFMSSFLCTEQGSHRSGGLISYMGLIDLTKGQKGTGNFFLTQKAACPFCPSHSNRFRRSFLASCQSTIFSWPELSRRSVSCKAFLCQSGDSICSSSLDRSSQMASITLSFSSLESCFISMVFGIIYNPIVFY